jgi:hypothetical protein
MPDAEVEASERIIRQRAGLWSLTVDEAWRRRITGVSWLTTISENLLDMDILPSAPAARRGYVPMHAAAPLTVMGVMRREGRRVGFPTDCMDGDRSA